MTPEEKLCSRSWRLRNSAGVLWSILSFGLLTGVNFLIRGVKSKNKLWIGMGIGFLIVGIGVMATSSMIDSGTKAAPKSSPELTIWGWVMFTSFIGGVIASFVTNKKWLIWKAHVDDRKWYAKAGATQSTNNPAPAHGYNPNAAAAAFAPQPTQTVPAQHSAPTDVPGGTIDVNAANVQDIITTLGVDSGTANRIVGARQQLGAFTSFEQLMSRAQVPPHLLIPHRNKLTFGAAQASPAPPAQEPAPQGSHSARKLDI
ncbi:helix-hairpin-helix domain-containing protein [Paenarthrobacter sp. YJN-5]|uniref:ComEA family DNA-binding protein n=1 Tax=Paenarthrobacter sp. YJN-5 TaxID=2735316 RepID=UPI0018787D44|nr:helix-hairpin-helix domain-containing protein [Paenarthrobacter sp. YJN-5]QOT19314.1 helix-hairpin-helix domain-containing protein [Paenarthrobacter sp. YJN-5]